MSLFRRSLSSNRNPTQKSSDRLTVPALEQARRLYYREAYDEAMSQLDEAQGVASQEHDRILKTTIALLRADILIARQAYEEATSILHEIIDEARSTTQRAPHAYALLLLGTIEQRQRRWEAARTYYEEARTQAESINTDGATGRALAHLGDVSFHDGNTGYAIHLYQRAIERLERSHDTAILGYVQGQLGRALIQLGQTREGFRTMRAGVNQAIQLNHRSQIRTLRTQLGDELFRVGRWDEALKNYEIVYGLDAEQQMEPDELTQLLARLSHVHLRLGNAAQALDFAERAHERAAQSENAPLQTTVIAVLGLARDAVGQTDEAYRLLHTAYEQYAQNGEVDRFALNTMRRFAQREADRGEIEDAAQHLTVIRSLAGDDLFALAHIYKDLAARHAQLGNWTEAVTNWEEALTRFRETAHHEAAARVLCDIGNAHQVLGQGYPALRAFDNALDELNHLQSQVTRGVVLANAGAAFADLRDFDAAEKHLLESIEIAVETGNQRAEATRRGNYGLLIAQNDQPKKAITVIMKARNQSNEQGMTLQATIQTVSLGIAYLRLGHLETARNHITEARETFSTSSAHSRWHGWACAVLGEYHLITEEYDAAANVFRDAMRDAQRTRSLDVLIQTVIGQAFVAVGRGEVEKADDTLRKIEPTLRASHLRRQLARWYECASRLAAHLDDLSRAKFLHQEGHKHAQAMHMPERPALWIPTN